MVEILMVLHILINPEDLSLSSVAPTMEALEEELAQYQDLLNDTTFQMDFSSSKENDCRAEDAE